MNIDGALREYVRRETDRRGALTIRIERVRAQGENLLDVEGPHYETLRLIRTLDRLSFEDDEDAARLVLDRIAILDRRIVKAVARQCIDVRLDL